MTTAGRKLLSSIVTVGDANKFVKLGLTAELFKDSEKVLYSYVTDHLAKYGKLPSPDTVQEHVGDVLVETTEPCEFYLEQVELRHLQSSIKTMVIEVQELLKDENPEKAFEILMNGTAKIHVHRDRHNLLDFRNIDEVIYAEYMASKSKLDDAGMLFGWPTIDGMSGGLRGGDLCSFVGRPAAGKTFMGLSTAHHAWKIGRRPLFVSMEMTNVIIGQRLAAMHSHKNLTHLIKGIMTTKAFKAMMTELGEAKKAEQPFWLVDSNLTTTIDDIILLARQLNPGCVWVDGAYLLRHPNQRASRFEKITENAEWLKQRVAGDLDIPVVASYQFSREAAKKKGKKGEKTGLEDIYGTDSIGQLSTIVMGMFEDDTSVEAKKSRKIEVLKGRNGEAGMFRIRWEFDTMDFSEILPEEEKQELQYL